MSPQRAKARILLAVLRFACTLGLLLAVEQSASWYLVSVYAHLANATFLRLLDGHGLVVRLMAPPAPARSKAPHASLVIADSDTRAVVGSAGFDCHRAVFVPVAVFIGLCVAWHSRQPRRFLAAVVVGLAALVFLPILAFSEGAAHGGSIRLGPVAASLLTTADRAIWAAPGMAFVVPAAFWLATLVLANGGRRAMQDRRAKVSRAPASKRAAPRSG